MPQRQENKPDLRQRIIEFSMEAFHKNGIKDVTMDSIARSLRISKRTLYQLFADKDDLVIAGFDFCEELEKAYLADRGRGTDNVMEILLDNLEYHLRRISGYSPSFIADLVRYPRIWHYVNELQNRKASERAALFVEGVRQGYFLPDLDYRLITHSIVNQFKATVIAEDARHHSLEKCFINICLVSLRGCATLKGIGFIDDFIKRNLHPLPLR